MLEFHQIIVPVHGRLVAALYPDTHIDSKCSLRYFFESILLPWLTIEYR